MLPEAFCRRYMHLVWERDVSSLPVWERWLVWAVRIAHVLVRDLASGDLNLRAMSLVYTTLLSIVPLLALSFSVLKAFGAHNQIRPMLLQALAPLGEKGVEITDRVIEFVNNIKVGVLGAVGLVLLFYTVISLMQKIEDNFNFIWRVHRRRSIARRFSDYLSVIIFAPVLVFAAMALSTAALHTDLVQAMMQVRPLGRLISLFTDLLPFLLVIAAFTFVYVFIPNTRVRFHAALGGAIVAGVLWQLTGWIFAAFIVGSAKYAAIYSAFATLILFMIWLYAGWLILLLGSSIAFYLQNPRFITPTAQRVLVLSNRMKEQLALAIMAVIGRHYYARQHPCDIECLAAELGAAGELVEPVAEVLEARGFIERVEEPDGCYLPAVPLDDTPVGELLDAIRSAEEGVNLSLEQLRTPIAVNRTMERMEAALQEVVAGKVLRDLIDETAVPDMPSGTLS